MTTPEGHIRPYLQSLLANADHGQLRQRLEPKPEPSVAIAPVSARTTPETLAKRWQQLIEATGADLAAAQAAIADDAAVKLTSCAEGNIENYLGTARLPIGLAGPLRVNGLFAQGDYYLPLATTEGALVASYHRGAGLITTAGGCTAVLLNEGLDRAPGFAFANLREVGEFVVWLLSQTNQLKQRVAETTRHGRLIDTRVTVEGNHVYLNFEFTTGDAAGQNMVTMATEAICQYIVQSSPVKTQYHFVEANLSGDKKACAISFLSGRGKKVSAEVQISSELIEQRLATTPKVMTDYWRMSALGGVLSGSLGVQGHYANGLAALYIACGQDAACVAESAIGVTRFELLDDGSLYAAVTLPNLVVGTVGGGTQLPTQRGCLEILGLAGLGHAQALAEVAAGLCLAGELSIIGALCSGNFSRAHRVYARRQARGSHSPRAQNQATQNQATQNQDSHSQDSHSQDSQASDHQEHLSGEQPL